MLETNKYSVFNIQHYLNNHFSQFDTRQTISDADEPHELVQLLRLL